MSSAPGASVPYAPIGIPSLVESVHTNMITQTGKGDFSTRNRIHHFDMSCKSGNQFRILHKKPKRRLSNDINSFQCKLCQAKTLQTRFVWIFKQNAASSQFEISYSVLVPVNNVKCPKTSERVPYIYLYIAQNALNQFSVWISPFEMWKFANWNTLALSFFFCITIIFPLSFGVYSHIVSELQTSTVLGWWNLHTYFCWTVDAHIAGIFYHQSTSFSSSSSSSSSSFLVAAPHWWSVSDTDMSTSTTIFHQESSHNYPSVHRIP